MDVSVEGKKKGKTKAKKKTRVRKSNKYLEEWNKILRLGHPMHFLLTTMHSRNPTSSVEMQFFLKMIVLIYLCISIIIEP